MHRVLDPRTPSQSSTLAWNRQWNPRGNISRERECNLLTNDTAAAAAAAAAATPTSKLLSLPPVPKVATKLTTHPTMTNPFVMLLNQTPQTLQTMQKPRRRNAYCWIFTRLKHQLRPHETISLSKTLGLRI